VRDTNRKVLKLGVSMEDLARFVRAHEELGTRTLSETLGVLLDVYERARSKNHESS
jgi:hypothetical protein